MPGLRRADGASGGVVLALRRGLAKRRPTTAAGRPATTRRRSRGLGERGPRPRTVVGRGRPRDRSISPVGRPPDRSKPVPLSAASGEGGGRTPIRVALGRRPVAAWSGSRVGLDLDVVARPRRYLAARRARRGRRAAPGCGARPRQGFEGAGPSSVAADLVPLESIAVDGWRGAGKNPRTTAYQGYWAAPDHELHNRIRRGASLRRRRTPLLRQGCGPPEAPQIALQTVFAADDDKGCRLTARRHTRFHETSII